MKKIIATLLVASLLALPRVAGAKEVETSQTETTDTFVITAIRIEIPTKEVASSLTVISSQDIENQQKATVLEVLRGLPGLDVVQAGGPGGQTAIFLRGAKSEHTLVLIDGMEMNNPITPGRSFDFAHLTADNIERIEIIRGPQSTLYGSDAIGGVINIITKKGKGKPRLSFSAEAGTYNTFEEKLGFSFGNKLANCSLSVSRLDTDGISAASKDLAGNDEKDGYQNTSISARLGLTPAESFEFDLFLRTFDARADLDNFGGASGDDPNYIEKVKQLFVKAQARVTLFNDLWEQRMGFSLSRHETRDDNPIDADHPADLVQSTYIGDIVKWDWQHNIYLHDTNTFTFGVELEEEKGKFEFYSESIFGPFTTVFNTRKAQTNGFYLQDHIKLWNRWITTLGVRQDKHSTFGSKTTFRLASACLFPEAGTKLKATYGTGFKAPTLYQLFSQFGNENLAAEKSVGWDVGFEQSFFKNTINFGITYFQNVIKNLIEFDGASFSYKNISEAETKGLEVNASVRPTKSLTITANYTNTDAKDKTNNEALIRRPKNKYSLGVNHNFLRKGNVNLGVVHVGDRPDKFFDPVTYVTTDVTLDAYTLLNLAMSYNICKHFQVFGRVENLLSEKYEEVKGYGSPGTTIMVGVKALLGGTR